MGRIPVEQKLYIVARKWEEKERRVFERSDFSNKTKLANHFRDEGFAVQVVVSEADIKKVLNKAYMSGTHTLSNKEIIVYDLFYSD